MRETCIEFRTLLERELMKSEALPTSADLTSLSWHEHLLGCEDCRELLRAEEALEELLSSLPQPTLPPHLAERVLLRLRTTRRALGLDDLLELDGELASPAGLSDRILANLAAERTGDDGKLDRLLDRHTVEAPPGLAARVLAGLEAQRAEPVGGRTLDELLDANEVQVPVGLAGRMLSRLEAQRAPAPTISFFERRVVRAAVAMAAGIVAFVGAYLTTRPDPKPITGEGTSVAIADPALLEDYYVLDNWGLLMAEDVDVLLATSMDDADEAVLDLEEGE